MKKKIVLAGIAVLSICLMAAAVIALFVPNQSIVRSTVSYTQPSQQLALERVSDMRPPLAAPCAHESNTADTIVFNSKMVAVTDTSPVK